MDAVKPAAPANVPSDATDHFDAPAAQRPVLGDWYANAVWFEHRSLIVFVNERTLLTVAVNIGFGPVDDHLDEFRRRVRQLLRALGIQEEAIERESVAMSDVAFARTSDRSFVASMSRVCQDFVDHIMVNRIQGTKDLMVTELSIVRTPYKILGYSQPEMAVNAYFGGDEAAIQQLETARKGRDSSTDESTGKAPTRTPRKKTAVIDAARKHVFVDLIGEGEWTFVYPRLEPEVEESFVFAYELHELGDLLRAEGDYRNLIRLFPEFIDAHHHLAILLEEREFDDAAYRRWKLAVEIGLAVLPPGFQFGRDRLPWGAVDNRPFLRAYLGLALQYLKRGRPYDATEVLENLLDLNPTDDQGARLLLVAAYLEFGDSAAALRVCDRFEDDTFAEISYGRVLALFRLDRLEDAADALHFAYKNAPLVADELVKDQHEPPEEFDPGGVTRGQPDEAFDYWLSCGTSWLDTPDAIAFVQDFLSEVDDSAEDTDEPPENWSTELPARDRPDKPGGETVH